MSLRHSREGGNPGFGAWIPGLRSTQPGMTNLALVIPAKAGIQGFGVWIPGLRFTQPGMTNLALVIPAKAGIQGSESGFRVFVPLSPE